MPTYKLKDLVTEVISGEWGEELTEGNEGTKIIRTTNFSNVGKVDLNKEVVSRDIPLEKVEKKRLLVGDTIIEKSGGSPDQPVGRVVFFEEEDIYLCNNFTSVLRPNKDLVVPKYFMYLMFNLHRTRKVMKFQNKTTGIINLKLEQYLNQTLVHLPNVEVQEKIAKVLDKTFDLITKRQSQITALDELTKSLFLEMFGDPINNPKKWEMKKLKDVTDKILSGSTPKGGSKVYTENGITFLRSQNVWKNRLNLDDVVYIDKETHNKMINSSLKYGDILMTKTGRINTENSSLGRAAIFRGKDDSANINGHVYLIRLQKAIINEFILFILTTDEYREYIRSVCVGGIDKRQINKEHLEKFPIIWPPVELQVQFSKQLTHAETLKSKMKISLKELEDTFNSILQCAFKGELFQA